MRRPSAPRRRQPSAPRRRLVVHVGPPKGGTTSIQFLLAARARALARRGIHVLAGKPGGGQRGTHNHLAAELGAAAAAAWTPGWARLAAEIRGSGAPCFVLSGEALASPPARAPCAAALGELADRERLAVEVVGYVRPQWQLLEAAYVQHVKVGRTTLPFDRFAATVFDAEAQARFDYNAVFARQHLHRT